jgi:iron-sulfur cluster repair protein YtfE (RIC family)
MHALSHVSHEHHALLRDRVGRLSALADCLCPDCLDTPGTRAALPEIRAVARDLDLMLIPHMDAVEATVYPTLERIMDDRRASAPMREEHQHIRELVLRTDSLLDSAEAGIDRYSVLALRRVMLRLHMLLRAHLDEWELYLPVFEQRLTPEGQAALGRALDHVASVSL